MSSKPLLDRLDTWLSRHRPDYYAQLRPGLTAEQLADSEKSVGFAFPESFRGLYRWHDGQANDLMAIRNNQYFMPSEEVKSTWEMLTSMQEGGEWEEPQWWHRGWIPFLSNGAGSHLCLDLHGSFTGLPGQVIEFWGKDADRPIVAPGFEVWLEHFVGSLEAGLWSLEEGGNFSPDEHLLPKIPGYPVVGDSTKEPGGKPMKPRVPLEKSS